MAEALRKEIVMQIFTYKNPFELNELEFWEDICKYPHLCVSQTLVEGLKEYYGRQAFSLLCTIDKFLKNFYDQWHGNNENTLFQYIHLSNAINNIQDETIKKSFRHNRNDVLKSIRFMIECEIQPSLIDQKDLTEEQKCLVKIYTELCKEDCFNTLINQDDRNIEGLYSCTKSIIIEEVKKYIEPKVKSNILDSELLDLLKSEIKNEQKKIQKYLHSTVQKSRGIQLKADDTTYNKLQHLFRLLEGIVNKPDMISFEKVYIHGVHQFTPLIYKFVKKLQELNIQVIFIFNYCEEFSSIYNTWSEVYKWTRRDFKSFGSLFQIIPRQIGENIGNIFEGNIRNIKSTSEVVYKFDNLTSFTDYVAPIYRKAKELAKNEQDPPQNINIIAKMSEQFYAVNGSELNALLKVYFPEHFGGRHFLSYPIGQFILGLYNMWDAKNKEVKINDQSIKKCLALSIWKFREGITPLQMYYDLALYFKGADTFNDYYERLQLIKKVVEGGKNKHQISKLSFFSYTGEDIKNFIDVLEFLNDFTKQLFKDGKVDLKEHYQSLIEYITKNVTSLDVSEKEQNFILEIKTRLDGIEIEDVVANIEDIKETLHFYLTANEDKEFEAEWIVRDFEQIDGGVLLAKAQQEDKRKNKAVNSNYHFAGLSEKNMLSKAKNSLPWPLSIDMIEDMNDVATLIAICKKEYNNFLRYSLFYGTYFLSPTKEILLSYIEELDDTQDQPYSVFNILNLKIQGKYEDDIFEKVEHQLPYNDSSIIPLDKTLNNSMKRSARACYRRFLYNHCLDRDTYFNDDFNVFFLSQLLAAFRSVLNSRNRQKPLEVCLEPFKKYYPFMDAMDFKQIQKMAESFINGSLQDNYIETRLEFKYFKWHMEEENKELLNHISKATQLQGYEYNKFLKDLDRFINNDEVSFLPDKHNWKVCDVCNQKHVCCYGIMMKESQ